MGERKDICTKTIIIVTDREQLEHTIKQIYGESADAYAYLQKMIHFELTLDCGVVQDDAVLKEKFSQYVEKFENTTMRAEPTLVEFFEILFRGIEIRTVIQWIDKINLVHQLSFEEDDKPDYDILFYELFWTILTTAYKVAPALDDIKISLDNPFGNFTCLSEQHSDWRSIPIIMYFEKK